VAWFPCTKWQITPKEDQGKPKLPSSYWVTFQGFLPVQKGDHLKRPWLSRMTNFINTSFVIYPNGFVLMGLFLEITPSASAII